MSPLTFDFCKNSPMAKNPFSDVDNRKWFDRMQPQTLGIATWLLYINGAFATIDYIDRSNLYSAWSRFEFGGLVSLLACASYIGGGFLMANSKKAGYLAAVFASFSPFILRLLLKIDYPDLVSIRWMITQNNTIGFIFDVALVALLLHPMSTSYAKTWFR